jgi:DNA ligase-1
MLLADVAAASSGVSQTRSRLKKVEILAGLLARLEQDEIPVAVAYLSGELPQGRIGIAFSALHSALTVKAAATASIALLEVDAHVAAIAATRGSGSASRRTELLCAMFQRATANEQDFLARLVTGELRQGALEGIMLDAIAKAANVSASGIRRAAMLAGGIGEVARVALIEGLPGLARFSITLFSPILPMLAQPADDVGDALRQLGNAAFEWKLDGARVQVHKRADEVRVYTRNSNDVTSRVPEVVEEVRKLDADELILDGEAIALKPNGMPQPFQVTMQRFGRKLNVAEMLDALPLSVFFFDVLYANGESLIEGSMQARLAVLDSILPERSRVPRLVTGDEEKAHAFLKDALEHGHEGVMAKSLAAPYEAGRRGAAWLKIKEAHTLDLVVLAAEWGHGRRQGFLSNLHLGARDPENSDFVMLGKTFKGMTDEMLAWQTKTLLELATSREGHVVYVRPELVVEIAFDSLQVSSQYPGGLALRFARVKAYRTDKRPEEADTIGTVRALC